MVKQDVKVPSVGESVTEVTVASFLVSSGAFVEEDTAICELESDKASVEIPAPKSGVITFLKKEGDTLSVGETFAVIDTEGKGEEKKSSETPMEKPSEKVKEEVL